MYTNKQVRFKIFLLAILTKHWVKLFFHGNEHILKTQVEHSFKKITVFFSIIINSLEPCIDTLNLSYLIYG